jgi:hypothetical protein
MNGVESAGPRWGSVVDRGGAQVIVGWKGPAAASTNTSRWTRILVYDCSAAVRREGAVV